MLKLADDNTGSQPDLTRKTEDCIHICPQGIEGWSRLLGNQNVTREPIRLLLMDTKQIVIYCISSAVDCVTRLTQALDEKMCWTMEQ
jgi:hypothetical protein